MRSFAELGMCVFDWHLQISRSTKMLTKIAEIFLNKKKRSNKKVENFIIIKKVK